MSWKATLLTVALGGALLGAGAGTVRADDRDAERLRREEWKLERDIARHGYYSHQAERRRWRMRTWRDRCRVNTRHDGWRGDRRWGERHRRDRDWDDSERWERHHRHGRWYRGW